MAGFDSGEMCFKDFCGVVHGNGDDRAFGPGSNLEASFMEGKHIQFVCIGVSGTFREDTDGNTGFYFFYSA